MLPQYFTFDELQQEYNFSITSREIKVQVKAAYKRNLFILPAFKKGKTHFNFVSKEEVEMWLKSTPTSSYNDCNNYKEIAKHYGLSVTNVAKKDFIHFMESRGIYVEIDTNQSPKQFKVINDDIFYYNWTIYSKDNNYEVCKEGYVRSTKHKRLCGSVNNRDGYIIVNNSYNNQGQYMAHRMIKETYDPIENSEFFIVDHINGKRSDNRLENLRWCYQAQNMQYKSDNLANIKELIPKCIQKYGYESFEKFLQELLEQ